MDGNLPGFPLPIFAQHQVTRFLLDLGDLKDAKPLPSVFSQISGFSLMANVQISSEASKMEATKNFSPPQLPDSVFSQMNVQHMTVTLDEIHCKFFGENAES